jgi:hypothetical protein
MSESRPSEEKPSDQDAGHVDSPHGGEAAATGAHGEAQHADEPLGPVDWPAWRAAIVGVAVAALMVLLFALAAWR